MNICKLVNLYKVPSKWLVGLRSNSNNANHRRNLWGVRGVPYPHFLDWGYCIPLFKQCRSIFYYCASPEITVSAKSTKFLDTQVNRQPKLMRILEGLCPKWPPCEKRKWRRNWYPHFSDHNIGTPTF